VKIRIYTTGKCAYCPRVKAWMDQRGLSYDEIRVDTNNVAMLEMIEKTSQTSVPTTIVERAADEYVIYGFDEQQLSRAVGVLA